MRQKQALTNLWSCAYFELHRSNKEIEQRLLDDFGITSSNITMILKKCKFLRKTPEGWIQKERHIQEGGIEMVYFEAGKPFTSKGNLISVLETLSGEIFICDPYINRETLNVLSKISADKVKFLSSALNDHLKVSAQEINDFKKENPNFELKLFNYDHLHDRYIIHEKGLIIIGQGLSARNKEGFLINIPINLAQDLIGSLLATFNRRWADKSNISY